MSDARPDTDAAGFLPAAMSFDAYLAFENASPERRDEAGGRHYAGYMAGERLPLPCPAAGWLEVDAAYEGRDGLAPTAIRRQGTVCARRRHDTPAVLPAAPA